MCRFRPHTSRSHDSPVAVSKRFSNSAAFACQCKAALHRHAPHTWRFMRLSLSMRERLPWVPLCLCLWLRVTVGPIRLCPHLWLCVKRARHTLQGIDLTATSVVVFLFKLSFPRATHAITPPTCPSMNFFVILPSRHYRMNCNYWSLVDNTPRTWLSMKRLKCLSSSSSKNVRSHANQVSAFPS